MDGWMNDYPSNLSDKHLLNISSNCGRGTKDYYSVYQLLYDMSSFDNSVTVGYWSIRGLAAPLRMMAMYAGAKLIAENYDLKCKEGGGFDMSAWKDAKPALRAKNPLMNLPYILDGDVVVTQTNACFSYLGKKIGLFGSNELEASQCEQLLCEIYDLRGAMVGFAYGPSSSDEDAKVKTANTYLLNWQLCLLITKLQLLLLIPMVVVGRMSTPQLTSLALTAVNTNCFLRLELLPKLQFC